MTELRTPWTDKVSRTCPLSEHPRPQAARSGIVMLNGLWDYAITETPAPPSAFDGSILVPFSPESPLSGVRRQLLPHQTLWYHRELVLPASGPRAGIRYILHLDAVDQTCGVYCGGKLLKTHTGGYLPFSCDLTDALHGGANQLMLCVRDLSDTASHSRGKQKLRPGGMYYTAVSGIWQPVWLEKVPDLHINGIHITADEDCDTAEFLVTADTDAAFQVTIFAPGIYRDAEFPYSEVFSGDSREVLLQAEGRVNSPLSLSIPAPSLWTPDAPWLYYAVITLGEDRLVTYFAFSRFTVEPDSSGIPRLCLHHAPLFQRGVLDQGCWPDGLFTAPSEDALCWDVREILNTGFNMVRKHAKIEAQRWYYHCDRMGLIVWQDMVNGGSPYQDWLVTYAATAFSSLGITIRDTHRRLLSRQSRDGRREFENEMLETADLLGSHPSIAVWVLFNEGWGQFDTKRLTALLKERDPFRLVDSASGWFDQGCGDLQSIHHYFLRFPFRPDRKRALVLSEFGGYTLRIPDHCFSDAEYGYRKFEDAESLRLAVSDLMESRESLAADGLCASVYTQWSDIQEEINGIVTYDRQIRKIHTVPSSGGKL